MQGRRWCLRRTPAHNSTNIAHSKVLAKKGPVKTQWILVVVLIGKMRLLRKRRLRVRAGKTISLIAMSNKTMMISINLCLPRWTRIESTSVRCANRSTSSKVSNRYKPRFISSLIDETLSLQLWRVPLLSGRTSRNHPSDTNDLSGKGVLVIISRTHDRHRKREKITKSASPRSFAVKTWTKIENTSKTRTVRWFSSPNCQWKHSSL